MKSQNGFVAAIIIFIVLALVLAGGIAYVHYIYLPRIAAQTSGASQLVATSTVASGSTNANSGVSTTPAAAVTPKTSTTTQAKIKIANTPNNWLAYNDSVLGISFSYPPIFKAQQFPIVIGDSGTVLVGNATTGITIELDPFGTSTISYYVDQYEQAYPPPGYSYSTSSMNISGYAATVITVPVQGGAGGHSYYVFDTGNRVVSIEANYLDASIKTVLDEMVASMKVSSK